MGGEGRGGGRFGVFGGVEVRWWGRDAGFGLGRCWGGEIGENPRVRGGRPEREGFREGFGGVLIGEGGLMVKVRLWVLW